MDGVKHYLLNIESKHLILFFVDAVLVMSTDRKKCDILIFLVNGIN